MGFLDDLSTSFEWMSMGDKEAASRIVQREVGAGIEELRQQEKAKMESMETTPDWKIEDSYIGKMDAHHQEVHGKGFFGTPDKKALADNILNFHGASVAGLRASKIMLNPQVMKAMDLWNMDTDTMNSALQPYVDEENRQAKKLLNELASFTSDTNGALAESSGGKLTSEEVEYLMEMLGTWNPEARMTLELENKKGGFLNQVKDKYGDILNIGDLDNFGGGAVETNMLTDRDRTEILTGLEAFGESALVTALTKKWEGDDTHAAKINQDWKFSIQNCAKGAGGVPIDPNTGTYARRDTYMPQSYEQYGGTEAGGDMGDIEKDSMKVTGTVQSDYYITPDILAMCAATTPHPFGEGSPANYGKHINLSMGLGGGDFENLQAASIIRNQLYGRRDGEGYIDGVLQKVYTDWLGGAGVGGAEMLTGVRVPVSIQNDMGVPAMINLRDERNMPVLLSMLHLADTTNYEIEFLTGDITDGLGKDTNFKIGVDTFRMFFDDTNFGNGTFEYGDTKRKIFPSYANMLNKGIRFFSEETNLQNTMKSEEDAYRLAQRRQYKMEALQKDGFENSVREQAEMMYKHMEDYR